MTDFDRLPRNGILKVLAAHVGAIEAAAEILEFRLKEGDKDYWIAILLSDGFAKAKQMQPAELEAVLTKFLEALPGKTVDELL